MNIIDAINAASTAERRFPVPLAPAKGDKPAPVAWWVLRQPDSLATARAGTARLLATPSKGNGESAPEVDPAAAMSALDTVTSILCASVVGVSSTEEGEADPVRLVAREEDAGPGALYVGRLQPVTYNGLVAAVMTVIGEGGDALDRFLAG